MFTQYNILIGSVVMPNVPKIAEQDNNAAPWWLLLLLIIITLLSAVLWFLTKQEELEEEPKPVIKPEPKPAKPDNLARIEGIGPKINSLLQEAGITTFAKLAETDVSRIQQILDDAKLRMADPGTWPEQAKLADSCDWEALDKLQVELKGGRRVS